MQLTIELQSLHNSKLPVQASDMPLPKHFVHCQTRPSQPLPVQLALMGREEFGAQLQSRHVDNQPQTPLQYAESIGMGLANSLIANAVQHITQTSRVLHDVQLVAYHQANMYHLQAQSEP